MRRYEIATIIALAVGFIVGKLIKNFKLGFAIAIVIGVAFAVGSKRRK